METGFDFEVLNKWSDILAIRSAWEKLEERFDHPFASFDWFKGWYGAFCRPEDIRLVVVRDSAGVRAIFPAHRTEVVRRGIRLKAIASAANGHTPRFAILSEPGDLQSVRAALSYPFSGRWEEKIDLVSLMNVAETSSTSAGAGLQTEGVFRHIENSFESPALWLNGGWGSYFASRSKNFRHRFRQSRNNLRKAGGFDFDFVPLSKDRGVIARLKKIDERTWQHANGTGLFSTSENEAFYTHLVEVFSGKYDTYAGFIATKGRDIAYELGFSHGRTSYLLKYGFDQEFSHSRPGVLVQHYLCEHLAQQGIEEIDLCGEATEEKTKWATHYRPHHNIWLLNQQSLVGKCTSWGLSLLDANKSRFGDAAAGGPA